VTGLGSVGAEVWLAAGYCLAMVGLAYAIDGFARRAATSADGGRLGGFVYHDDHDAWLCPEDQWLWPQSFDPDNRIMRYLASPTVCNSCPVKDSCTSSSSGREVQRAVDSWPASEAARFHRGIACAAVVFGIVWPVAVAVTAPGAAGLVVLAGAVLLAAVLSVPLWSHLWRSRVHIPEGMRTQSLDQALAEREAAVVDEVRRRSRYASDHRTDRSESA